MGNFHAPFTSEAIKQAVATWWRRHIIDNDPYDCFEDDRLEFLLHDQSIPSRKEADTLQ
jgi:hypothetical protein